MHANTQRVTAALLAAGVTGRIREFAHPTRTAVAAAEQLGVEVGAIANTLVFDADGEPILVRLAAVHPRGRAAPGTRRATAPAPGDR